MYASLTQKKVEEGFFIEGLNTSVYSFEGFAYYLYTHLEDLMDVVSEGQYLRWIEKELGLEALADDLKKLYEKPHTTLSKMLKILEYCPYTAKQDMSLFEAKYESYVNAPVHQRYKMTGNKYFRRGDYVSALNWYKSSQAITYTNEVANNIALIHMHNNEFEKADKILLKALKKSGQA